MEYHLEHEFDVCDTGKEERRECEAYVGRGKDEGEDWRSWHEP